MLVQLKSSAVLFQNPIVINTDHIAWVYMPNKLRWHGLWAAIVHILRACWPWCTTKWSKTMCVLRMTDKTEHYVPIPYNDFLQLMKVRQFKNKLLDVKMADDDK